MQRIANRRASGNRPVDWLFKQRQPATPPPETARQLKPSQSAAEPDLRCISCRTPIASPQDAIEIAGTHRHTCTNPYGFIYVIGCFAQASGVLADSSRVSKHSWFPGYAWQIALCRTCRLHLGWCFSGESVFYGLILNRLITSPPPITE